MLSGSFAPAVGEELDAVVVVRIVRRADHDARRQAQRARQVRDRRRGQRPGQIDVDAGGGEAGLQRGLEQVAGDPRVLADQHGGAHAVARRVSAASTRPAAQPSFSTSSGVIGASPTRPRMPSVPKYRRVIGSTAFHCQIRFDRAPHLQRIDRLAHVVHADDGRAARDRGQRRGEARRQPLVDGAPGDRARATTCATAPRARDSRSPRASRASAAARDYAPASCRSQSPDRSTMRSRAMPAATQAVARARQEVAHLGHDVVIVRRRLHRPRLALHVHQADADIRSRRSASSAPGRRQAPRCR